MISSEREVAIDEVHENCIRAAHHYEKFDDLIDEPELERLVADLCRRRRLFAERLEDQIRAMNHLPTVPDPDREGLERLAARFRAALSGEGSLVLLAKCREIEDELIACVDTALRHRTSDELHDLLIELRKDAESAHERLTIMTERPDAE